MEIPLGLLACTIEETKLWLWGRAWIRNIFAIYII